MGCRHAGRERREAVGDAGSARTVVLAELGIGPGRGARLLPPHVLAARNPQAVLDSEAVAAELLLGVLLPLRSHEARVSAQSGAQRRGPVRAATAGTQAGAATYN